MMKRKRSEKRWWQFSKKPSHNPYLLPLILAGLVPMTIGIANVYRIPARYVVPMLILVIWIVVSLLLWQHAHAHASSSEWWQ